MSAGTQVVGPARVEGMPEPVSASQAAVDDLFHLPRETKLSAVSAPRLTGIRELYLMLTGDHDLHGGYYPSGHSCHHARLQQPGQECAQQAGGEHLAGTGQGWLRLVEGHQRAGTLQQPAGHQRYLGGHGGGPAAIAEGASIPSWQWATPGETASFTKYGGYIPLTLELIDRDETRKLQAYARELASAGMRKISRLVAAVFTQNAGIGPSMADGGALFNTTAVTSAGGHANLTTTALSGNQWDAVSQTVYSQPMLIRTKLAFYRSGPMLASAQFVRARVQKTAMEICAGALVRKVMYDRVKSSACRGSA